MSEVSCQDRSGSVRLAVYRLILYVTEDSMSEVSCQDRSGSVRLAFYKLILYVTEDSMSEVGSQDRSGSVRLAVYRLILYVTEDSMSEVSCQDRSGSVRLINGASMIPLFSCGTKARDDVPRSARVNLSICMPSQRVIFGQRCGSSGTALWQH